MTLNRKLLVAVVAIPIAMSGASWLTWRICRSQYSDEMRLVDPDDIVRMRDRDDFFPQPGTPKEVMFVKVSLTGIPPSTTTQTGPNKVDVSYSKIARYTLGGEYKTIEDLLDQMLLKKFEPAWDNPKPIAENGTLLSRLSLSNGRQSYMVFILDCANCRFMEKEAPFRVERKKSKYLLNPRVAWLESGTPKHGEWPTEGANATTGYFIAYSDKDLAEHGGSKFRSGFNLYLDLIYANDPQPVPISVDPDVGYPGGNS